MSCHSMPCHLQVLGRLAEVVQAPMQGANKLPDKELAMLKQWAHRQVDVKSNRHEAHARAVDRHRVTCEQLV